MNADFIHCFYDLWVGYEWSQIYKQIWWEFEVKLKRDLYMCAARMCISVFSQDTLFTSNITEASYHYVKEKYSKNVMFKQP
jgi:hypothetical protein